MGLRTRITVAVVLVTLTVTVLMALTAYQLQASTSQERFVAAARTAFDSDVQQAYRSILSTPTVDQMEVVDGHMRNEYGVNWLVLDLRFIDKYRADIKDGELDFDDRSSERGPMAGPMVGKAPASVLTVSASPQVQEYRSWVVISSQVRDTNVLLIEFFDLQRLRDELSTLRWQLALIATVVAVFGVAAALVAARHIQRPVRRVAAAARTVGEGSFDVRLPVHGRDELADLTGSFNAMAEQLRAKDEQQRRFAADVAHDLRTPVAAMVAAVDSLASPDPNTRQRSAELLGTQSRRLARLVEDLVEMSRFDAGVLDLRPEPVDLPAMVADAIELTAPAADITVVSHGDTTVQGDPRRLHTVLRNLLANAVHHGGEPITVTIDGDQSDEVTITVADSGPGISEELMPILFDRFVRGDRARRPTEGSGLGLSIARENLLLHNGRIEAANANGAVFTVTLPR